MWPSLSVLAGLLFSLGGDADRKPVQVYILAGQSNMEGHGQVRSLETLGEISEHRILFNSLRNESGGWAVRDDVFISWEDRRPQSGALSVGWGRNEKSIGPEFSFGTVMGDVFDAPVLLIKTAWGGKDVYCDFRSPSAGAPTKHEQALLDREAENGRKREVGAYYRRMVLEIQRALEGIEDLVPGYAGEGYELAGLAWFQGWNDYCQWRTRINGEPVGMSLIERYPKNLSGLFQDLRRELGAPDLPIVVGELGIGGLEMVERANNEGDHEARAIMAFRQAQRAVTQELGVGDVTFVPTADFWDTRLQELEEIRGQWANEKRKKEIPETEDNLLPTKGLSDEYRSRGGHWYCHYNGSAPNYALVGWALAEALLDD